MKAWKYQCLTYTPELCAKVREEREERSKDIYHVSKACLDIDSTRTILMSLVTLYLQFYITITDLNLKTNSTSHATKKQDIHRKEVIVHLLEAT